MARLEGGFWDLNKDLVKDLADTIFFLSAYMEAWESRCVSREKARWARCCASVPRRVSRAPVAE